MGPAQSHDVTGPAQSHDVMGSAQSRGQEDANCFLHSCHLTHMGLQVPSSGGSRADPAADLGFESTGKSRGGAPEETMVNTDTHPDKDA